MSPHPIHLAILSALVIVPCPLVLGCTNGSARRERDAGPPVAVDASVPIDALVNVGDATIGSDPCNGLDDDRDGVIDPDCPCTPGTTQPCFVGNPALAGVGACMLGVMTCYAAVGDEFPTWDACGGSGVPSAETCGAGAVDENCDGRVDEGCDVGPCTAGESRPCYSGPSDTSGRGTCRPGVETCTGSGEATHWSGCVGEVLPAPEGCDGVDRDCDGLSGGGCPCTVGAMRPCYSGASGTAGVGTCAAGSQTCAAMGGSAAWTTCGGETIPRAEICTNGADDDCDGAPDDGCGGTFEPPPTGCEVRNIAGRWFHFSRRGTLGYVRESYDFAPSTDGGMTFTGDYREDVADDVLEDGVPIVFAGASGTVVLTRLNCWDFAVDRSATVISGGAFDLGTFRVGPASLEWRGRAITSRVYTFGARDTCEPYQPVLPRRVASGRWWGVDATCAATDATATEECNIPFATMHGSDCGQIYNQCWNTTVGSGILMRCHPR